ncbi:Pre-rRNA-processing protein TSR2-domain-containing protein [Ochromonadaceae sp. CCMP2298]|nr:Pre-rRNA-processing protein TSR2-domain-containing protein [Ochromonadaceae sp. CCMP2298]
MTITRAQAARQAEIATWHPQAVSAFTEGVGSILRQWTALELAVHYQWGGPSSSDRADDLVKELVDMYLGPDRIYKDDVELVLEDYLETNFSTICEDGSPLELGDVFCDMWRQCIAGDFTLVTNALSRECLWHKTITQLEGLNNRDAGNGSDDGMEDAEAQIQAGVSERLAAEALGTIPEGEEGGAMEASVFTAVETVAFVPEVDVDGFETVARGKKTRKTPKV